MNPFAAAKSDDDKKVKPSQAIGGGLGWFDEISFEVETPSVSSVAKGVGGIFQDIISTAKQDIIGVEHKTAPAEKKQISKTGSIEFQRKEQVKVEVMQKKQQEIAYKKDFYQATERDAIAAKHAKEIMMIEEEVDSLPTTEKNIILHLQASYKGNKSAYHRAELRRAMMEQRSKAEKQQKQESMAAVSPKASAMNAAIEGGSGSQGGGQANLSFQAAG